MKTLVIRPRLSIMHSCMCFEGASRQEWLEKAVYRVLWGPMSRWLSAQRPICDSFAVARWRAARGKKHGFQGWVALSLRIQWFWEETSWISSWGRCTRRSRRGFAHGLSARGCRRTLGLPLRWSWESQLQLGRCRQRAVVCRHPASRKSNTWRQLESTSSTASDLRNSRCARSCSRPKTPNPALKNSKRQFKLFQRNRDTW